MLLGGQCLGHCQVMLNFKYQPLPREAGLVCQLTIDLAHLHALLKSCCILLLSWSLQSSSPSYLAIPATYELTGCKETSCIFFLHQSIIHTRNVLLPPLYAPFSYFQQKSENWSKRQQKWAGWSMNSDFLDLDWSYQDFHTTYTRQYMINEPYNKLILYCMNMVFLKKYITPPISWNMVPIKVQAVYSNEKLLVLQN